MLFYFIFVNQNKIAFEVVLINMQISRANKTAFIVICYFRSLRKYGPRFSWPSSVASYLESGIIKWEFSWTEGDVDIISFITVKKNWVKKKVFNHFIKMDKNINSTMMLNKPLK